MSKKIVEKAEITETSGPLGPLPDQKTSNTDPRTDTQSMPNPLQRKVIVGRHGTVNGVAPDNIEGLRPDGNNG